MEGNFGVLSLVPVILTIILAVKTKNVVISLFVGVFTGVLILVGGNPITATTAMVRDYFFVQVTDSYNAGVIVLLCFIGGFVALLESSGGAQSFAKNIAKVVNTRSKAQLAAWVGGIAVFFSELGTPLIVGPIFEPLFEKMKISKEKLAWILDSTSSPVCVLVPFIGWGVYSMGLIQKEFEILNITETDWSAFINAIPFQIYPILCLLIVPLVAISGYEFSFMAKAELNAQKGKFSTLDSGEQRFVLSNEKNVTPMVVILPLLLLFVTLFGILAPLGFPFKQVPGTEFRTALITGYIYAAMLMALMMLYYKVKTLKESMKIYMRGVGKMMEIIVILILAWSLGSVGKGLGTSDFIVNLAKGNMPAYLVPAIIFLIGSITSFATGTSWGTFAIMMPIAIPMAISLGAPLYVCIGAVLSGGLFGDHCSPISDTTILASTGAGCSLIDHVKTQMPYAGMSGAIAFVGYIVAGYFDSVIVTGICIISLFVVFFIAAKFKGTKMENKIEI